MVKSNKTNLKGLHVFYVSCDLKSLLNALILTHNAPAEILKRYQRALTVMYLGGNFCRYSMNT